MFLCYTNIKDYTIVGKNYRNLEIQKIEKILNIYASITVPLFILDICGACT